MTGRASFLSCRSRHDRSDRFHDFSASEQRCLGSGAASGLLGRPAGSQQGDRWQELRIGETIPAGAALRLNAGALAELSGGELRVTLHQAGLYSTTELLRVSKEAASWGIGRLVRAKMRALFSGPARTIVTAMGARAAEVQDDTGMGWMDDEEEALSKGQALLEEGRYEDAVPHLLDALTEAGEQSKPLNLFLIGYSYAMAGKNGPALKYLEQAQPPDSMPFYADYLFLKANLLLEGQGYARALELFDFFLARFPRSEAGQSAYFFSAFCLKQLGNRREAAERLQKAYRLDPDSEIGKKAREALNSF